MAADFWPIAGTPVEQVPGEILMKPEDVVDTALAGLDQGELVTIPPLPDIAGWQAYEAARQKMMPNWSLSIPAVTPFGAYMPAVRTGNPVFLSGILPTVRAALNVLSVARQEFGSLDRITRVAQLGVYVASAGDFFEQAKVADASELLRDILGEEKVSPRLVFGVASLPFGVPVELETILEVS